MCACFVCFCFCVYLDVLGVFSGGFQSFFACFSGGGHLTMVVFG